MENQQLVILKNEYDLLQNHLKTSANLSEYNRNKLTGELKSAKIINDKNLPADVVTVNSSIGILDMGSGQEFTFHLVNPSESDVKQNKLSVLAPIGIALLGYRTGSIVDWEMPNGIKSFKIVKVSQTEKIER